MTLVSFVTKQSQLPETSVKNTIALLEDACTIPFISRYRKERTGNLDEVQIAAIAKYKALFETLEKRKETIIKALTEQGVLTTLLEQSIKEAQTLITLEDLYLPFKKSRKTKAEKARQQGLEPLAKIIMSASRKTHSNGLERLAQGYIKGALTSVDEVLDGARHIIAEWINERSDFRNLIRFQLERFATLSTKVVSDKEQEDEAQKYRDYFEWEEPLNQIPSHRALAILRAEKEGYIKIKITLDDTRILDKMEQRLIHSNNPYSKQIQLALKDSYKRLLLPSLCNEALQNTKTKADEAAIAVFAKNLKQLLLGAPLGEKRILAIDPGYRTGCKVVCLDKSGNLKHNETIYPHPPQNDSKGAIKKISTLAEAYKIEAIAIGNGTASRDTENLIRRIRFKHELQVFVVSEAGASVYSTSKIAREEFPNFDVTVRGAVSIGRRLQDPLAELVKIDPKSIGVGQYQHDVDQTQLKHELDRVVESCVNAVGVNLNTASKSLLRYVSGIGDKLADNIVQYRTEKGPFKTRKELLNVPRLGHKAFEQGAAFLRIKAGKNPLDDSAVHPESYKLVAQMAQDLDASITDLIGNRPLIKQIDLNTYTTKTVGLPTLEDIASELEKPGLDLRAQAKVFTFNQQIKTITDLKIGQLLPGIVNNITNFGAFVDIGIKESGLIHVSNISESFVADVNEHVHLHQQVIVKVLAVDVPRKRIQLKLESQ